MLAVGGRNPIGYYKDPDKTAATFKMIDGRRYSIPGDYATVEADGTIHLMGRGSVVINTGGEKVFPEEVEEAVKSHGLVLDAVAVGIPDERFGEAICAIVEVGPDESVTAQEIMDAVRAKLAGFKVPRQVIFVDSIGRAPNGKVDYAELKHMAMADLGLARA